MKRGDISRCSLQVFASKAIEKESTSGQRYTEAFIDEWIEISSVIAPGFANARIDKVIAESLGYTKPITINKEHINDLSTMTNRELRNFVDKDLNYKERIKLEKILEKY